MLFDLLKFVLRTRFSRPFLVFFAIMIGYSIIISQTIPQSGIDIILGYYAAGLIAFFLAMALATGGVMVMKSDRDYLFTLPLSTRDLSIAIFFAQFVAFGVTVLLMFAYLAQAFSSPLLLVDLAALALTFTSLGAIAPSIQTRPRILLSAALALWTLLSFINVPFTPGSAFNGNLYGGTATLLALAAVTVTLAFRSLSRIELDMMKSMVRSTSADIKSPSSFAGRSPIGAIYSMNLSNMSLAGRMNMAGTARYVSRRVKTKWVAFVTSAAGAAYFIGALSLGAATTSTDAGSLPAEILVSVILSFLAFFLSQSAITNERIWLSLTSLPPASYFKHLIGARVLSLMVILAPFAIADAVLLALGHSGALGAIVVVLAVIPGSFVLEICWAAYIAPIQIKGDDMMMPAQFNLKQMATALPFVVVVALAAIASVFPIIAAAGGVVLCGVSALLTTSSRFWRGVVTKLTENGFI
ncbi:MAG TPA: hypothetical protein VLU91_08435 [Nitrososphaerales archaeon]|nr:hypothetical protein [Nitrososphaerales archaeon]